MFKARSEAGAGRRRGPAAISIIGAEMVVSGNVTAGDELRIDGRVDGDVRCVLLTQGEGGVVAGNIVAEEARLAGRVEGRVEVGTLLLEATARIAGDVTYESLSIARGARVEGRLALRGAAEAGAPAPVAQLFPTAGVAAE